MTSKLEQQYEDQIIICKGLSLLKVFIEENKIGNLLTKEQQERLFKLSELEFGKLAVLEKELEK